MRCFSCLLIVVAAGAAGSAKAQQLPASSPVPVVEYQYQLHYPRPWLGYPRPGLSLGGTLPEQGGDGISSLYGLPFPWPLGYGVYRNPPAFMRHSAVQPVWPESGPMLLPAPIPTEDNAGDAAQSRRHQRVRTTVHVPNGSSRLIGNASISPTTETLDASVSSPASRQLSLEQQAAGDVKLQAGHWPQACLNYRNAVDAAEDRAEAHLRLGFAHTALQRFPLAVREFKRALSLDPAAASSEDRLTTLFGPDSDTVRESIQRQVTGWVREDLHDVDRLFLLGLWLHFDDDARAPAILEAALRFTDQDQHILALLAPTTDTAPIAAQPNSTEVTQSPRSNSVSAPVTGPLAPSTQLESLPFPPSPTPDDTSSAVSDRDSEGQLLPPLPID